MRSLLAIPILLGLAHVATAQSLPPETRAAVAPDGKHVQLTTTFAKRSTTQLQIGKAKAATLHTGEAAGALAAGHDKLIVALATDAKTDPFKIIVVTGDKRGQAIGVARPGTRKDHPFAVAATATKAGFAVFFQEVQADDPSAAHTYLLELDDAGKPNGDAKEIAVPWSLAAAVDNGNGYHLALIYPGDGMRISMVSLTADGSPQQHPDWASPAGFITQVQLVRDDKTIRAFYKGGKNNDRIHEIDVTKIRDWGSEPPKPKDHGVIGPRQALAVANGKPVKIGR
ncbi:MAG TPA: hypothetical protein VIU61_02250 [Kofleriaceae bacterium]